jgi:hypothetical protein
MIGSERERGAKDDEGRSEQEPALHRETIEDLEPVEDQSADLRGGREPTRSQGCPPPLPTGNACNP